MHSVCLDIKCFYTESFLVPSEKVLSIYYIECSHLRPLLQPPSSFWCSIFVYLSYSVLHQARRTSLFMFDFSCHHKLHMLRLPMWTIPQFFLYQWIVSLIKVKSFFNFVQSWSVLIVTLVHRKLTVGSMSGLALFVIKSSLVTTEWKSFALFASRRGKLYQSLLNL